MVRRHGYTLIEVLVGLTIIGIIFSVGFVSFREFSRRQQLASAARSFRGDLHYAQELALAGNKPSNANCNAPNTLLGFNFRFVSGSNYVIEASCSGGNVQIESRDLPTEIVVTAPAVNPILFKVLGKGTNIDSGSVTITLTQVTTSRTVEITVNPNGEIN